MQKLFSSQTGLAKGRTIVLVTHRTELVHFLADQFIQVSDGQVSVSGQDPFPKAVPIQQQEDSDTKASDIQPNPTPEMKPKITKVAPKQFIEEERREEGGIKLKVFLTFVRAGRAWWIFVFCMLALFRILTVAEQWVYKAWGEAYGEKDTSSTSIDQRGSGNIHKHGTTQLYFTRDPLTYLPSPNDNLRPWIILLLSVGIGRAIVGTLCVTSQFTAIFATTSTLFAQSLQRITNATFRYYDITPAGRILNRLTSDIDVLDSAFDCFSGSLSAFGEFITSLVVIASVSPIFLLFSGALVFIVVSGFLQFLPTSRSLKRLEATALSPLYTIFGELLQDNGAGLTTIRAFRAQPFFQFRVLSIIDQFQAYNHFFFSVQNWFLWRFENISNLSAFLITVIALATDLSPGLTAFLLINANNFVIATRLVCTRIGNLQTEFVSVERIVEVLESAQEPEGSFTPPASWPRVGPDVTLKNVTIKYAPDLEPALHDISLEIPGGRYVPTPFTIWYSSLTQLTALQRLLAAREAANPPWPPPFSISSSPNPAAQSPSTMPP